MDSVHSTGRVAPDGVMAALEPPVAANAAAAASSFRGERVVFEDCREPTVGESTRRRRLAGTAPIEP
jgi:hypothetical protein